MPIAAGCSRSQGIVLPLTQHSSNGASTATVLRRLRRQRALTVRAASSRRQTEQELRQLPAPPAPPTFVPPPPPVPPPPSAPGRLPGFNVSRRGLFALMIGGAAVNVWFQRRGLPPMQRRDGRFVYVKTKGGNDLAVSLDDRNRLFMFDTNGNMYYDTGDPKAGWTVVDINETVYNYYVDPSTGNVERKVLGQLNDMVSVPVKELGGVPIEDLQREWKLKGNEIVGFPDRSEIPYPPQAPLGIVPEIDPASGQDSPKLLTAPVLEEGAIIVDETKRQGWFAPRQQPSLMEQLQQLRRGIE